MSLTRAKITAQPRYARVYDRATQLTEPRAFRSTPMVYKAVAMMVVSMRDRKRPKQTLQKYFSTCLFFFGAKYLITRQTKRHAGRLGRSGKVYEGIGSMGFDSRSSAESVPTFGFSASIVAIMTNPYL